MKNITLTATGTERELMVNWDNVHFAKECKSPYGDDYVEVSFGKQCVDVKETLQEIHEKCLLSLA
jgi:phosphosulfolactate synthase (CoM biosynthesis protein A)